MANLCELCAFFASFAFKLNNLTTKGTEFFTKGTEKKKPDGRQGAQGFSQGDWS